MMGALGGMAAGALGGQLFDQLGMGREAVLGLLGRQLAGKEGVNSGSALLRALGLTDPGSLGDTLGGFGVDVLADPMTWLGLAGGGLAEGLARPTPLAAAGGAGRLQGAARAAGAANAATGKELGVEGLKRLGTAVTPEAVAAGGPRVGTYGQSLARKPGGMERGSNVPMDVRMAGAGQGRKAAGQAREALMGRNAAANDTLMQDALAAYQDPYQGQTMALPGMMLSPQNPARGNPLMMMEPSAALAGLDPLAAAGGPGGGQLSPLEIAMLLGSLGGAVGGGVYAGM